MKPDRISLLNTARCLLEGRQFESDVVLPLPSSEFIEATDVLKPLLSALSRGELDAKGVFARIRLDYPEFDGGTNDVQLTQLSTEFRQNEQIILGIGEERQPTDIPPTAWWFEGAIWEKSTLWVSIRDFFDEQRWRGLKIQPAVASLPERPYDFEELICFREINLSLDAVVRWADADKAATSKKTIRNERGAGQKPDKNMARIEAFLQKKTESGQVWSSWFDVWCDVTDTFKDVEPNLEQDQPYRKLEQHLRRNNPDLLDLLRTRIKKSRTYEPRPNGSTN